VNAWALLVALVRGVPEELLGQVRISADRERADRRIVNSRIGPS